MNIVITWIKGHDGNPDNDKVDELARMGTDSEEKQIDEVYEQQKTFN